MAKCLGINYFVKNKIQWYNILQLILVVNFMVVYRCISEREIADMIGIPNHINSPRGQNTFKYEKEIDYKHFFYYYDSAISFMNTQNCDRYYDKYSIIMAYDIENEILRQYFGLGEYNLKCVPKELKDSILCYFKTVYYPEFAIPKSLITKDRIVGIGNKNRITPINYIHYETMHETVLKSEKAFLDYEKWLFQNGTNVSKEMILENSETLFPLGSIDKRL